MKYAMLLAGLAVTLFCSGCMTGYTTMHHGGARGAERDSLMPPPMTVNDVIALSQDSVGDEVIISQMKATESYFRLTTDDIVALRKAGVSDKVINAMIKTSENPPREQRRSYPVYYPYWGNWWYPYWYPWYSPLYFGVTYRAGYYGGYHFGGVHYGGSRGVRTGR